MGKRGRPARTAEAAAAAASAAEAKTAAKAEAKAKKAAAKAEAQAEAERQAEAKRRKTDPIAKKCQVVVEGLTNAGPADQYMARLVRRLQRGMFAP